MGRRGAPPIDAASTAPAMPWEVSTHLFIAPPLDVRTRGTQGPLTHELSTAIADPRRPQPPMCTGRPRSTTWRTLRPRSSTTRSAASELAKLVLVPQHWAWFCETVRKDLGQPSSSDRDPQAVIERPHAAREGHVAELGCIAPNLHLRASDKSTPARAGHVAMASETSNARSYSLARTRSRNAPMWLWTPSAMISRGMDMLAESTIGPGSRWWSRLHPIERGCAFTPPRRWSPWCAYSSPPCGRWPV